MDVTWEIIKAFAQSRKLSIQYVDMNDHYYLKAIDGAFELSCRLYKLANDTSEVEDFEDNFQAKGNKSPVPVAMGKLEVEESWTSIKARAGILKYRTLPEYYIVWKVDEEVTWFSRIMRDAGVDVTEFEASYKVSADTNAKKYLCRTPDEVPIFTPIKNFSWNSINRVTHDFCDKRTWWKNSTTLTDAACTNSGDHTTYSLPVGLICPYLISDRDLLGSTYNWTIKNNGVTVTNYSVSYANHTITFNAPNLDTDVITCSGKQQNGSAYDLVADAGKYLLVDYIEIQVSQGCTFNDTISFELILNHAGVGNSDYVVGKTTFNTARDFLNKSNYGNSFPPFGEMEKTTIILPWNFATGYKLYPVGTVVDPYKNEFNKLRARLVNNLPVTDGEVATATFYCYERKLT